MIVTNRKPRILRMYPRIAKSSRSNPHSTRHCVAVSTITNKDKSLSATAHREELRQRLLKMIVENERARRQGPHAS